MASSHGICLFVVLVLALFLLRILHILLALSMAQNAESMKRALAVATSASPLGNTITVALEGIIQV